MGAISTFPTAFHPTITPINSEPTPLVPGHAGYENLTCKERLSLPAVATRAALLQRLETIGMLAPASPLSFLVVHVEGIQAVQEPGHATAALGAIAKELSTILGPLDLAGRYGACSFGVVLQGRGEEAAAAIARRLNHYLNQLEAVSAPLSVEIYAATGSGRNARELPLAAADSLPEVS